MRRRFITEEEIELILKHKDKIWNKDYELTREVLEKLDDADIILLSIEAERQERHQQVMEKREQKRLFDINKKVRFDGDIIITDPCYVLKDEIWSDVCDHIAFCEAYEDIKFDAIYDFLGTIGIHTAIFVDTLYGDWGCTTYETTIENADHIKEVLDVADKREYDEDDDYNIPIKEIGGFCADAGLVCVFSLDELKKSPYFDTEFEKRFGDYTNTIIKDFHGEVEVYDTDNADYYNRHLIGIGNINFITSQTSL